MTTFDTKRGILFTFILVLLMFPSFAQCKEKKSKRVQKNYVSNESRLKHDIFFLESIEQSLHNPTATFDLLRFCVSINPESSEAYFLLSTYYNKLKRNKEALFCLEKAVNLSPNNTTYAQSLASLYIRDNRFDEAIALYETLDSHDKYNSSTLRTLLNLYLEAEDYDQAISTIDRLEVLEDINPDLSNIKFQVYLAKGDTLMALDAMKNLYESHPNDLTYRALYGCALLEIGMKEEAVNIFNDVLLSDPDNLLAQFSLHQYYRTEGEDNASDSMFIRYLLNPNLDNGLRFNIMSEYVAYEKMQDSLGKTKLLHIFDTLSKASIQDAEVEMLHASYLNLLGVRQDSVAMVLENVLKIDPGNSLASIQLILMAWKNDDIPRVIQLCKVARLYNPDNLSFYYYEGIAHLKLKEFDEAIDVLQNSFSLIDSESDPNLVSDLYFLAGDLYKDAMLDSLAYTAFDSCLKWKPDNVACLNNYSYYLCLEKRDLDRAERMSLMAITIEPDNATYLDTYAWILFVQSHYEEAKAYIDKALQCLPATDSLFNDSDFTSLQNNAVIFEHAGDIYFQNKDIEKAIAYWQDALRLNPKNSLLSRKIKLRKYIE